MPARACGACLLHDGGHPGGRSRSSEQLALDGRVKPGHEWKELLRKRNAKSALIAGKDLRELGFFVLRERGTLDGLRFCRGAGCKRQTRQEYQDRRQP